jgi:hypothetical protein
VLSNVLPEIYLTRNIPVTYGKELSPTMGKEKDKQKKEKKNEMKICTA